MNLTQYLQGIIKNKDKLVNKPIKERKKKLPRVARRGLGFGMRHRNYREYKDNKKDNIDSKLLTLLTGIFKNLNPIQQSREALNPFIEKEKQQYSYVFEPRFENIEKKLLAIEDKKEKDKKEKDKKDIKLDFEVVKNMTEINNKLKDYEIKWTDLIENQESLNQELDDIPKGSMDEHIQDKFRQENLNNKSDILSLQRELQEDLNKAEDLNDYKSFIDFQDKVLNGGVDNFVRVDNRLSQELKEQSKSFQELQEQTREDVEKYKEGYKDLQLNLERSESKVIELTNDLVDVENKYIDVKQKLQDYEINNPEPPRLTIKSLEEEDEEEEEQSFGLKTLGRSFKNLKIIEEFKPPSPKPKTPETPETPKPITPETPKPITPEIKEPKKKIKLKIAEPEPPKKLTKEEKILLDYVNKKGYYAKEQQKAIEKLFGEEQLIKIKKLGTAKQPKIIKVRELLIDKGIDKSLFT